MTCGFQNCFTYPNVQREMNNKMKSPRNRRHVLRSILIVICVAILMVFVILTGCDLYENYRTNELDERVREMYLGTAATKGWYLSLVSSACAEEVDEEAAELNMMKVQADFLELYEENKHTVGWLTLGEKIDYPVVQYDNEYYLTHNFFAERDSNGTLFLNMDNRLWPRDDVLLIHGHNMKSGAMFGRLTRYEQYDYLIKYPIVTFRTIYDKEDVYYVPIAGFNASMIPGNSEYFDITRFNFENDIVEDIALAEENGRSSTMYQQYLNDVQARSLWKSPMDVNVQDELLILVTCSYRNEDGRFMLVCRKLRADETLVAVTTALQQSHP